jgi:hypothetical protein
VREFLLLLLAGTGWSHGPPQSGLSATTMAANITRLSSATLQANLEAAANPPGALKAV